MSNFFADGWVFTKLLYIIWKRKILTNHFGMRLCSRFNYMFRVTHIQRNQSRGINTTQARKTFPCDCVEMMASVKEKLSLRFIILLQSMKSRRYIHVEPSSHRNASLHHTEESSSKKTFKQIRNRLFRVYISNSCKECSASPQLKSKW